MKHFSKISSFLNIISCDNLVLYEGSAVLTCFVKLLIQVLLIYCKYSPYITQEVGQSVVHIQGHRIEIEIERKRESYR